jgi:hypothetical protein
MYVNVMGKIWIRFSIVIVVPFVVVISIFTFPDGFMTIPDGVLDEILDSTLGVINGLDGFLESVRLFNFLNVLIKLRLEHDSSEWMLNSFLGLVDGVLC